jgi:hypothetical protein
MDLDVYFKTTADFSSAARPVAEGAGNTSVGIFRLAGGATGIWGYGAIGFKTLRLQSGGPTYAKLNEGGGLVVEKAPPVHVPTLGHPQCPPFPTLQFSVKSMFGEAVRVKSENVEVPPAGWRTA